MKTPETCEKTQGETAPGSLTGRAALPSVARPWMKYYPPQLIEGLAIPENTLMEYLRARCPGEDVPAIHYYGRNITWRTLFEQTERAARALRAVGFGENDQIPVFLQAVPEYIYLLLAAEKIGASLLCRDNTLKENAMAVVQSGAKIIFAHDFLSQSDLTYFRKNANVQQAVLLSPYRSGNYTAMPDYVQNFIDGHYTEDPAYGPRTIGWDEFLELGAGFTGTVEAPKNIDRPLLRAYTSGSTGPSKQVIHSAHSMIGNMHQMNFYGGVSKTRPTWMMTCLPPSLVAVVVAMVLLPLASGKLLILDPFCDPKDVDLEMMRYRPNNWPLIPMLMETLMASDRIPADYDMSHLLAAGAGCEALNNSQLRHAQQFLDAHNCRVRFTTGYGCSEGGSNLTLPMTPHPMGNGNVGVPMPLSVIGIFRPGTQQELQYNEIGEICVASPGIMLGYGNATKITAQTVQVHADGMRWLHTGDLGYMNEDGVVYTLTRGRAPRYGFAQGEELATLPMENCLADAAIEGIKDEFFVIVPDPGHRHYFLPYLYVVLKDGYTIDDVRDQIAEALDDYMQPVEIIELPERPFFHFKTDRVGLTRKLFEVNHWTNS